MACVLPSLYEHLNGSFCCAHCPPSLHFVEHFDGDTICLERWNLNNFINTNTFAMSDEVDGGFTIATQATSPSIGVICFNNKRTFSPTASTIIYVIKGESTASANMAAGFDNDLQSCTSNDHAWAGFGTDSCCFRLRTSNTGTITGTSFCVAKDTCYHIYKLNLKACDIDAYFDEACVTATATTNLPNNDQNPVFYSQTVTSAVKTAHILYMEAFGT